MKKIIIYIKVAVIFCLHLSSFNFNAQTIASGDAHSLAVCSDGTVMSWGYNIYGALGDGTNTSSYTPVPVSNLNNIIAVAGGGSYSHSLFLKNDSTAWASGYNTDGQLADGTTIGKNIPVQVIGIDRIIDIASGERHSIFLKNDGTVWSSGYNYWGQLGDATTTNRSIPVQVNGLSGIVGIAAGKIHSLFLKNDGTVWACGRNSYGQLGNGTTLDWNIPEQVSGLSNIIAIAAGDEHSLFLRNDGKVFTCGRNTEGRLGDGTATDRSTPVQVIGISGVIAIAGGGFHSLFVKNDGSAWACGHNWRGQLGDGTITDRLTPVQVNGLNSIISIEAGYEYSVFLKNDGTFWACGRNSNGSLGDGTNTQRNTPIQTIGLCNVLLCSSSPAQPVNISGNTSVCANTTHSYTIPTIKGATGYTWTVPSGATINSGQGTRSISVTFGQNSGNIYVTADNACGNSQAQLLNINVSNSVPSEPISISGNDTVCSGTLYVYSISSVSDATSYTWSVPSGVTVNNGQGSTSISITYGTNSGEISVTADNACGNSSAQSLNITLNSVPAQPSAINGNINICSGTTHTYSISSISNATGYTWSVPSGAIINSGQGTSSISVTFGQNSGDVSVTADNDCGNSQTQLLNVTISTSVPSEPISISGNETVCSGSTYAYSVSSVSGATGYTWTVPSGTTINNGQGSTSISITYGTNSGIISVTADNVCGNSSAQSLNITLNTVPTQPNVISGNEAVCTGTTFTYSVSSVSDATSYTWNVPSGAIINSGQGTTSILVTFGTNSGNVSITAENNCGSSDIQTKSVTVHDYPDNEISVSDNNIIASETDATYQWLDCNNGNEQISGATLQSFTPIVSGSYAVEVTNNGCTSTSNCVTVSIASISENSLDDELLFYPNPTNGELTIQSSDFEYSEVTIIVRNLIGQETMRKNFTSTNKLDLIIEGDASIYIVEIIVGEKKTILKVIKK
jgi:alpha-tubulin suppressor-like RCC1 family protein